MITRSPTLANLTALAFSIYELALSGAGAPLREQEPPSVNSVEPSDAPVQGTTHEPIQDTTRQLPFACSLIASSYGGSTHLEGRLQAREAIFATYTLTVLGPGLSINQGGELTLSAGESTALGEASVSGAVDSLEATLTITVDGQAYACALQEV
jgi:hypothetical protein